MSSTYFAAATGIAFAPVAARMSMVISAPAEVVWDTVSKFGKQALWMYADDPSITLLLNPSERVAKPNYHLSFLAL